MAVWAWVIIIIAVLAVAVLAVLAIQRARTAALRRRFGAEYDRTVAAHEAPREAEAELRGRERQRRKLDIKPLSEESRTRYAGEWRGLQERFIDQPVATADAADALIGRVMQERGYPAGDFAARADLLSVDYPRAVEDYRLAHDVHQRAHAQQASTEDLREALVKYRSLLFELLRTDGAASPVAAEAEQPYGAGPGNTGPHGAAPGSAEPAGAGRDADTESAGTQAPSGQQDGGADPANVGATDGTH